MITQKVDKITQSLIRKKKWRETYLLNVLQIVVSPHRMHYGTALWARKILCFLTWPIWRFSQPLWEAPIAFEGEKEGKKKSKWHRTHFFLWLETQRKEFPTIPNIFSNSLCKKPKDLINKMELVYSISYWYPSKFIFLINSSSSQTQLNQNKS